MSSIRQPAVAGLFYPGEADILQQQIRTFLRDAAEPQINPTHPPKAIVAPHAGYIYSGPIAATAYAYLKPLASTIERIVLLGPSHRVPLIGFAVPSVDYFATPLGNIPLDKEGIDSLLRNNTVTELDVAHSMEHSLEVHLPFLQTVLSDFKLIPIVVGEASPAQVDQLLTEVWGGDETFIVISTDLSHYLDYNSAVTTDHATCKKVEDLDYQHIGSSQACGYVGLRGLLVRAKQLGLHLTTVDYRNSGDTAGGRDQVVGYAAYVLN